MGQVSKLPGLGSLTSSLAGAVRLSEVADYDKTAKQLIGEAKSCALLAIHVSRKGAKDAKKSLFDPDISPAKAPESGAGI